MPTPTLLKKAAGSIKRDRKDVRAVMTVNESQAPANPNINVSQTYLDLKKSIKPIEKEQSEIYNKYLKKGSTLSLQFMPWERSGKRYEEYKKIIKSDIYKEKTAESENLSKKIKKIHAEMRVEFNKNNPKLNTSNIDENFIKTLNDKELLLLKSNVYGNRKFSGSDNEIVNMINNEKYKRLYTEHVLQLKNNPEEKYKLTKEYLQELEDNYRSTSNYKFEYERNLILRGLTNNGEDTKKLPLNEQFNAVINRMDGGIRSSNFNEKEKGKFANYFFANRDSFNPIIDSDTKKRRPIEYEDFYEYMPSSLTRKIGSIHGFSDNYWESASSIIRQTAYDKNLNRYDGKENTYEVLDRVRKKYPLVKKLEDPFAYNIFDYMKTTPTPSLIIPTINNTYKFVTKMNGVLKNEWNDYKKEKGFRFYDELSDAEKNALRSSY